MAVRDSVKVVSRAKPHVSQSIGRIGNLIDNGSPRSLRLLERERRYLNALGFSVRSQIRKAIEADIISALDKQQNLEELERLGALAQQAADRLTLSEIKKIQGDIKRARQLARARRDLKMGDRAIRRIAEEGVSAKAPLMGEFTESSMELARRAHPQVWVWTANASACAVCLSLHGSRRQGAFNPPHPNCLCIAEAPGQSRPLTDDEIAEQMIKRGGRDARLGQALKDGKIDRDQLRVRREGIIKQRNIGVPEVKTLDPAAASEKWGAGLAEEQRLAIERWSGPNEHRRIVESQLRGEPMVAADQIMEVARTAPTYQGTAYRGMTMSKEQADAFLAGVEEGGLAAGALQSFSRHEKYGKIYGTPLPNEVGIVLEVQGSASGKLIESVSRFPAEGEVLYMPGAKFEYISHTVEHKKSERRGDSWQARVLLREIQG